MTIIDKIKDLRKQYPDNTALFDLKTGNKITFTQIVTWHKKDLKKEIKSLFLSPLA